MFILYLVQTKRTRGTSYHSGLALGSSKYYPAEGRAMVSYTPYTYVPICLFNLVHVIRVSEQNKAPT